jgi:transposase-like protein
MMPAMSKRTFSTARWRTIIAAQQASGLSIAAFCRRARVPSASFYTWRQKLREAVSFAEVKVAPEPVCATSGIELHLSGQRCVVVRAGFDRQTLLDLLATLETGG